MMSSVDNISGPRMPRPFDQLRHQHSPGLGDVLLHRAQCRRAQSAEQVVVVADHRDIAGHVHSRAMQRADAAECDQVAGGHDAVERDLAHHESIDRGLGRLRFELHTPDQCVVDPDSRLLQGFAVAAETLRGFRVGAAQEQDALASEFQQVLGRAPAAEHVVGAHGAVFLAGYLRTPHDETGIGFGQPIELIV